MIKVSAVVPVYNAEKYLDKCINSLVNQTLKDIELIFVDDGSSDSSVQIIKSYMNNDERIILLTQNNSYAGVARNNGLKKACGEYIIFLDADDYFESNMLEEMHNKALADDADVCICSAKRFNDSTGKIDYPSFYLNTASIPQQLPFSADDVQDKVFNFTSPAPWTKMFKTSFIRSNGLQFQAIKKTNDLFFVFSNLALANRITYLENPFVNYRTGNSQSLQGVKNTLNLEFYEALIGLKKELQRRKLFNKFEKSFVNRALSVCVYVFNEANDKENFLKLVDLLKNQYFYDFGIVGHSRAYFYVKADFDVFLDVMEFSGDELWNKYKADEKSADYPLINIDDWKSTFAIQNTESPKVSVVIPVYNVEKYLKECVESVINNTLKDIEIICVNDGSTDGSLEILNRFKEKDSRVVIVNKENGGLSSARNAGLNAAAGKYVLFVDSDDYIHEKTLEFLYCEAEKDNLDQLYFSAVSFYDNENIKDNFSVFDTLYKRKADYSKLTTGRKMFSQMVNNGEFRPSACLQLNKKEFLDRYKLSFYEGILHEDNLFTVQCLAFAERVRYVNINLYYRRVHENSIITGESAAKRVYSYYKIIKMLEQFAVQNNLGSDKDYFFALVYQLSVIDFNACDVAENLTEKELADFSLSLNESEAIDFYNHINAVVRLRIKNKNLSKQSKANAELAKITDYKLSYQKNMLKRDNDELRAVNKALKQENKQLKSTVSKKLVRIAIKLNEFLSKLLKRNK